jgi:CheY-like chemotaxis protein
LSRSLPCHPRRSASKRTVWLQYPRTLGPSFWFHSGGAEVDDAGRLAPQLRQQQEQQKPDIDGIARRFAKSLDRQNSAEQTKNIPIIAVTACATPEDKANALKSGCDAYVVKPVNIGNLLKTVESFLSSSSS